MISTASKADMINYISNSKVSMDSVLPAIVNKKVKEYEKSEENMVRSARYLYDGNLISKRKYNMLRLCTYLKDPANSNYRKLTDKKDFIQNSFVPRCVQMKDTKYCYCGLMKAKADDENCFICGDELSVFIARSARDGKVLPALKSFVTLLIGTRTIPDKQLLSFILNRMPIVQS